MMLIIYEKAKYDVIDFTHSSVIYNHACIFDKGFCITWGIFYEFSFVFLYYIWKYLMKFVSF